MSYSVRLRDETLNMFVSSWQTTTQQQKWLELEFQLSQLLFEVVSSNAFAHAYSQKESPEWQFNLIRHGKSVMFVTTSCNCRVARQSLPCSTAKLAVLHVHGRVKLNSKVCANFLIIWVRHGKSATFSTGLRPSPIMWGARGASQRPFNHTCILPFYSQGSCPSYDTILLFFEMTALHQVKIFMILLFLNYKLTLWYDSFIIYLDCNYMYSTLYLV